MGICFGEFGAHTLISFYLLDCFVSLAMTLVLFRRRKLSNADVEVHLTVMSDPRVGINIFSGSRFMGWNQDYSLKSKNG